MSKITHVALGAVPMGPVASLEPDRWAVDTQGDYWTRSGTNPKQLICFFQSGGITIYQDDSEARDFMISERLPAGTKVTIET